MMTTNIADKSYIAIFENSDSGSHCGYCSTNGSLLYGVWTYRLTTLDYQDMIDRGWRRSGKYCYKPAMSTTCCPQYTIRCDAPQFRLSRSHRRLLKQVAAYLNTGTMPRHKGSEGAYGGDRGACEAPPHRVGDVTTGAGDGVVDQSNQSNAADDVTTWAGDGVVDQSNQSNAAEGRQGKIPHVRQTNVVPSREVKKDLPSEKSGQGGKSKAKRWSRHQQRMQEQARQQGRSYEDILKDYNERRSCRLAKNKEKTLEDYLDLIVKTDGEAKHKLEIRLVQSSPRSKEFSDTVDKEHAVYSAYQHGIHGDSPSDCNMQQFTRFLVDSPLMPVTEEGAVKLGSFHQQYWLDGELIAVGVVDILPRSLSSVYLFYNPKFDFLSLGTYSALREIAFTRELKRRLPSLNYYYMGFYLQNCPKMRYKGQYSHSYLACPETYSWQPMERCRTLLAASKYARLDPDPNATDPDQVELEQLDQMVHIALNANQALPLSLVGGHLTEDLREMVADFAKKVGARCLPRLAITL